MKKVFRLLSKIPHAGIACRCLACRPQRRRRKLKRATAPSFWLPILIKARVRFAQYILNFRYHVENFKTSATEPRIFDLQTSSKFVATWQILKNPGVSMAFCIGWWTCARTNAKILQTQPINIKFWANALTCFLCFKFLAKNTMSLWKALPQRKPRLLLRTLKLISLNEPTTKMTNATATTADVATWMRYAN